MSHTKFVAVVFQFASAVVQANQCPRDGECPTAALQNGVSLLQTRLQTNAIEDQMHRSSVEDRTYVRQVKEARLENEKIKRDDEALVTSHDGVQSAVWKHSDVRAKRAGEPSETTMEIHATQTAMSLLSKFRVCGHENLIRAGPNHDDGYVIPGWPRSTDSLGSTGTMLSIGVRGDDPVSHYLSDKFDISAHLYDCYGDPSPCPAALTRCNVTFHNVCAGGQDRTEGGNYFQTIQGMVQDHAPGLSNNLILKIDCEGCEWDALDVLPVGTLNRFKLLITEMHWLEKEADHEKYLRVMTKLTQDFAIVHTHGCNCYGQVHLTGTDFKIPKIVETTFVRKNLLSSAQDCSMESTYRDSLDFPICPGSSEFHADAFKLPELPVA